MASVKNRGGIDADRVLRGGSWNNNNTNNFRCANRNNNQPDNRNNNVGFRVVCSAQLYSIKTWGCIISLRIRFLLTNLRWLSFLRMQESPLAE